ncbi:MAG: Peptide chain release factor 1 [Candidatus Carbobacillus altaicus]|uniref:Peptide chain release factor 1 n=1 Tax=Candidatus Carbonibacillus altaicus TaxID=2163959 RepID=A0A2R6Y414_9BACL|nr:MAG: Peptide chain release factor 1 [Candidatus Carbobacillus altaicus]
MHEAILHQLDALKTRYDEITAQLSGPDIVQDRDKLIQLSKEQADLSETVETYLAYKEKNKQLDEAKALLEEAKESDLIALIKEEIATLEDELAELENRLKRLLLPKDPNDEKNVIMEIRAAAGGEEAALFAAALFRMYSRYAEDKGWRLEMIDAHYTDLGGIKEITFMISGRGVYSKLKYENGAHRVQRVPETESAGRIHTSTATVTVMPEAEEVEVEIQEKDLRIDTFASSGPGGQSVNTTMSAVRITHLPTGIVVSCQDEKSQHKNKEKALKVLRARLYDKYMQEAEEEAAKWRRQAVGTGDRSERIRTYNFPQNRLTDHRIGLTLHRLDQIMDGDLDEVIDSLGMYFETQALEGAERTHA